jgi:antitoxin component of MazEF toxin-antitoxin module
MRNDSFQTIKKPWVEGSGTLCFGIPSNIVKKLNMNQNSYLLIDLMDDSIIVIKKIHPQFSKVDLNKVMTISHENNTEEKPLTVENKPSESKEEKKFENPLKDLDL